MNTDKKNHMPFWAWSAILMIILIIMIALIPPGGYTLQYLEDGELQTESFKTTEGFNNRVIELQADSIKYWLDLN